MANLNALVMRSAGHRKRGQEPRGAEEDSWRLRKKPDTVVATNMASVGIRKSNPDPDMEMQSVPSRRSRSLSRFNLFVGFLGFGVSGF